MSEECSCEESDPPQIQISLGEFSIFVQGSSAETAADIESVAEEQYRNTIEDFVQISDYDIKLKGCE